MLPSSAYGWPADQLCLHMAFVDFDGAAALEAVEKLPSFHGRSDGDAEDGFVESVAPRVVEGVQKLKTWLENGFMADQVDLGREESEVDKPKGLTVGEHVGDEGNQKDYYDKTKHYDLIFRSDHIRLGYFPNLAYGTKRPTMKLNITQSGFALTEHMVKLMKLDASSTVLDMGCGKGMACLDVARSSGVHCAGVDLSSTNIKRANELKAQHANLKLDFYEGSITDLPEKLKSNQFSHIMSVQAWVHVHADLDAVLQEAKRALKPGGLVVCFGQIGVLFVCKLNQIARTSSTMASIGFHDAQTVEEFVQPPSEV